MRTKTTRSKIIFHAREVLKHIGSIYDHLHQVEEIAQGNSPVIEEHLPTLVNLTVAYEKVMRSFRDSL